GHGDSRGRLQAVDAADAVAQLLYQGELPGGRVALEYGDGAVLGTDGVHVVAVGAHRHVTGAADPVDAADSVAHDLRLRQRPVQGAAEDGDGIVSGRGGVDVHTVRTGCDSGDPGEPVDAADAVCQDLREGQRPGAAVAAEHDERVVGR